jgi:alpha-tubulin suppressor-like RCC1 family protein
LFLTIFVLLFAAIPSAAASMPAGERVPSERHFSVADPRQPAALALPQAPLTGTTSTFLPAVFNSRMRGELVSVGYGHACALTSGRTLVCWGAQIGDVPTVLLGLEEPVSRISAAGYIWGHRVGVNRTIVYTCAVTVSGAVKCWPDSSTPARAREILPEGAIDVSTGARHACILMADGAIRCWGVNQFGELGTGTLDDSGTPVPVVGLRGKATAVTTGIVLYFDYATFAFGHTCALIADGSVQCWGNNREGQLGNGESGEGKYSTQPVTVSGLGQPAVSIHTDWLETCALLADGSVKCWGGPDHGPMPKQIEGLPHPMKALADRCAIDDAGVLYCWQEGQAGAARRTDLPGPVTAYGAGKAECLATIDGDIWCNGYNGEGMLGNGQGGLEREDPVDVYGLRHGVVTVTGGEEFACALMESGQARCWGGNDWGQFGNGLAFSSTVPAPPVELPSIVQLDAGKDHACARTENGEAYCWGANDKRQLGSDAGPKSAVPILVPNMSGTAVQVAAGGSHTCALVALGNVQCWGSNVFGQAGGQSPDYLEPTTVAGLAAPSSSIGTGVEHTCALLNTGAVQCWGSNQYGQLGVGASVISATTPITVAGLAFGVKALAVGAHHACVAMDGGTVQCWGVLAGSYPGGQPDLVLRQPEPMEVAGLEDVAALAAGGVMYDYYPEFGGGPPPLTRAVFAETCAITGQGAVRCWSMGLEEEITTPKSLTQGVTSVTVGSDFACAVTASGGARCWGRNLAGQLGNASPWSPFWVAVTGF